MRSGSSPGKTTPDRMDSRIKNLLWWPRRRVLIAKFRRAYPLSEVVSCLCGGTHFQRITEKDRYGIPVGTSLCKTCGLGILTPRICDEALKDFYLSDYRTLYRGGGALDEAYFARSLRRGERLVSFLLDQNALNSGTAVEIGCGPGGILKALQNIGFIVYGCEYDRQCVTTANAHGVETFLGGIESLIERGIKADLVVLSHLLEHIPDPVGFLGKVRDLVSDGGMIYIEVPGLRNPKEHFFKGLQVAHLYYFDERTLGYLLARSGFVMTYGDDHVRALVSPAVSDTFEPPAGNFEANMAVIEAWRHAG